VRGNMERQTGAVGYILKTRFK